MIFDFFKRKRAPPPAPPTPPALSYRELVASLPLPTAEQADRFTEYVCGAHSWYKHLPCTLPGALFVVFLDPNAGREQLLKHDGRTAYRDRVKGDTEFHYTWTPTATYLETYGHWHYATDHGTRFITRPQADPSTRVLGPGLAEVLGPDGTVVPVPPDLLAAGSVHLTAHVHETFVAEYIAPMAQMMRRLHAHPSRSDQDLFEYVDSYAHDLAGFDREIEAIRARQRAELRDTLDRVRALLAG